MFQQTLKQATSTWYTTWVWRVRYNNNFSTKLAIEAGWTTGAPQNCVDPTVPCTTQQLRKCNKTENIHVKIAVQTQKLLKDDITQQHIDIQAMCIGGHYHLFIGTCEASIFECESDFPIRFDSKMSGRFENFESPRLPRLPSYHKQHSLFNDKFQSFRHYWDLY